MPACLTRENGSGPGGAGVLGAWIGFCTKVRSSGNRTLTLISSTVVPEGLCQRDRKWSHWRYCCSHLPRTATDFNPGLACDSGELSLWEPRPAPTHLSPFPMVRRLLSLRAQHPSLLPITTLFERDTEHPTFREQCLFSWFLMSAGSGNWIILKSAGRRSWVWGEVMGLQESEAHVPGQVSVPRTYLLKGSAHRMAALSSLCF